MRRRSGRRTERVRPDSFLRRFPSQLTRKGLVPADGTTNGGWDLITVLAEGHLHTYPVALLVHRPFEERRGKSTTKARKSSRIRLMSPFLSAFKKECECQPSVLHVDKDFAEITAIEQVWPWIKIQTCLWHLKKAITRRLCTAGSKRVSYSANEVRLVLHDVSTTVVPANATVPKQTIRNPFGPAARPRSLHPSTFDQPASHPLSAKSRNVPRYRRRSLLPCPERGRDASSRVRRGLGQRRRRWRGPDVEV